MKEVAVLLNTMVAEGIIQKYAVFGAIAQMRYTEAVSTMDAEILVALPDEERFDLLSPLYDYCRQKGYLPDGEAVTVGDWPVQFIPAFDSLTRAALAETETGDVDGEPLEVVSALFLALIALNTGRPKDYARLLSLLESGAVTQEALVSKSTEHGLLEKWQVFAERFLSE